jgi:ADP-heptose:LPS heptosyltransferase
MDARTQVLAGLPTDVLAAWPAMCDPVRRRYAAGDAPNRLRELALKLLRWEAARQAPDGPLETPSPFPGDARILAIRLDNFGDALAASPAYRLLKQALPESQITVLAGPGADDAPRHCPAVSRVVICRHPAFDRGDPPTGVLARLRRGWRPYSVLLDTAARLREERFHLAINFRPEFWWGAALAALCGIPRRLGYASAEGSPFLSDSLPARRRPVGLAARTEPAPHEVERNLELAQQVLRLAARPMPSSFDTRMVYEPTNEERSEAWRLWRAHDLDEARAVVAIHPEPGAPAKRWPAERFALVASHLAGYRRARVIITGGPADVGTAQRIAAACHGQPVVLAGRTSYGVLAALLERCRFAVGTDNGAMHLASARGVPHLRLFGPTDPVAWGPWPPPDSGSRQRVQQSPRPCAPCHRLDVPPWAEGGEAYPCMADVRVDEVIASVEALWAATEPQP